MAPPVMHHNDSGWYLTGFLQDEFPVDMLLDTGATFSLLPQRVFDLLPGSKRPDLEPVPGCKLTGFTGEKAEVRGVATLSFYVSNHSWKIRFLVVQGVRNCILGSDFLREHGVRLDYAQGLIWCNQTFSTILQEVDKSASAKMVKPHDLKPRSEGAVEVFVSSFPPHSTVLVEGTVEDLERGFVLANSVVALDSGGRCRIRVMNPTQDPLTIQPCNMGRVSLVSEVQAPHPLV